MVGIVVVSHSGKVAEGVCELALEMVPEYQKMIPAGGLSDGTLGTDPMKILEAVQSVNDGDGVAILVDIGSSVMSAEVVIEMLEGEFPIRIADAPLVEGAVTAVIAAANNASLEEVIQAAEDTRSANKFL